MGRLVGLTTGGIHFSNEQARYVDNLQAEVQRLTREVETTRRKTREECAKVCEDPRLVLSVAQQGVAEVIAKRIRALNTQDCETCGGEREVPGRRAPFDGDSRYRRPCPDCNGTGKAKESGDADQAG